MGVKTAQLVEGKGRLAGARIVREGYQVMLISDAGTVIRMAADGIKRSGRATQGVIVTRLREGEHVSTLAPVVGSDEDESEPVKATSAAPEASAEPADDVGDEPELEDEGPADDDL
jgi:DNA gyrase subunit A